MMGWQWHHLDHMQIICTSLQTDNHTSTSPLSFWATVCKTVRPVPSDHCLSVCPVCNVGVLWPNGWTDQDETWHAGRPRPWPHCVRWAPTSPPPKGGGAANFRSTSVVAKWLDGSRCYLVWRKDSAQATLC